MTQEMTPEQIQMEINGLKNILAQRDNDALEAMDQLVVQVANCKSILSLTQVIFDCLRSFAESAQRRIELRAALRELIEQLEPEE